MANDTNGIEPIGFLPLPEPFDDSEPDDSREYDDEEAFDGAVGL